MKRIASIFAFCLVLMSANATKVYINPGHGSWGPNCRPMATINYAAGDTLGFFESNTNLWKAFMLETKLKAAGFEVKMSRRASAIYPYAADGKIAFSTAAGKVYVMNVK